MWLVWGYSVAVEEPADDVRRRIVVAAAALIAEGGRDAATTRAVSAAAGVQAPTMYRLFGDKRGLLDAVAEHVMASYVATKATRVAHVDPVQDLRDGWDTHVAFGLAHPALFAILSGDAEGGPVSAAAAAGMDVLRRRIHAVATSGRLRVSKPRAVALMHATGIGTVHVLLGEPADRRDLALSALARESVLAAITGEPSRRVASGPVGAAVALRASLDAVSVLTAGELHLLAELLDRIADGG